MDLLINNGTVVTCNDKNEVLEDVCISIKDGIIESIDIIENIDESKYKNVIDAKNKNIIPYHKNKRLVAFAGIGYPKKFFNSLDNVVAHRSFPDHYQYTDEDILKLHKIAKRKNADLVTTEKDWMRLSDDARNEIKCVKLETIIEDKFFVWLKEKLNANSKKAS